MIQIFRTASTMLLLMTVLTGMVYPVVVTIIAQVAFPYAANGSLIKLEQDPQRWAGSELVGQPFSDPKYFWGRPSGTAPFAYNGMGGSGSNQAPTNPALLDAVRDRIAKLREYDPENTAKVPVDLVTASASGLDPHITEAAALYQAGRVARLRQIDRDIVNKLILTYIERPTVGVLGQTRVNVLKLNLALDAATAAVSSSTAKQ